MSTQYDSTSPPADSTSVAKYLADHPHFFNDHPTLLSELTLSSPLTGRALSLQERQMEVLREKYKVLELHLSNLSRTAQDNAALAAKFHGWTQTLLQERPTADLPHDLIASLKTEFDVPHATLRLWNVTPDHKDAWFVKDVSEDARIFANGLGAPYCGRNHGFEAVGWIDAGAAIASTAILPLRRSGAAVTGANAFGLLVLGSLDAERFTSGMATDFLVHISATASNALSRLSA